jgi:hypothetical protein
MRSLQAASCTYRIALGARAGQKVLSLRMVACVAASSTQVRDTYCMFLSLLTRNSCC